MRAIGVHGVGVFLPEPVRKNDWWPASIVSRWGEKAGESLVRATPDADAPSSEGARRTLAGMAQLQADPFGGARERRVMPEGMLTSDMEAEAVRDVLARSGARREDVGLLLTSSQLPDYLGLATAPIVHHKLGLSPRCPAVGVEASSNSFIAQLYMAAPLIQTGQLEYAVLVQSSGDLHLAREEDAHSPWFGDGATAVLVGPVQDGRGLLGQASRTDGSLSEALVVGCPGGRWYGPLRQGVTLYVPDPHSARRMLLSVADMGREVLNEALERASVSARDIAFYASHQATAWFRPVTQEHLGLGHARSVDTFGWTGSLGAANVPICLAMGEREGLLRPGDLVATFSGGGGVTYSSAILRWGT